MNPIPLLLLLACAALAGPATATPAPLSAEQAFRISGRLGDDGQVTVRLQAAPGHYLYRDKLRFAPEPGSVGLGAPRLPAGEEIRDEFFGRVRILRGTAEVRMAARLPPGSTGFTLVVHSQGCADAGICYPPRQQRLLLERGRPEEAGPAPARPPGALVDQLREPVTSRR